MTDRPSSAKTDVLVSVINVAHGDMRQRRCDTTWKVWDMVNTGLEEARLRSLHRGSGPLPLDPEPLILLIDPFSTEASHNHIRRYNEWRSVRKAAAADPDGYTKTLPAVEYSKLLGGKA